MKVQEESMFDSLWNQLAVKKPALIKPETKIEITSANFKKVLRQFYDKGYQQSSSIKSLFDSIFGDYRSKV